MCYYTRHGIALLKKIKKHMVGGATCTHSEW